MAPPFKEVEFDIIYGEGISREGELLDLAELHQVLEKTGTWYAYKGERIGQGRENARNYLKENPAVCEKLESELRQALGISVRPVAQATPEPALAKSRG